jgi:hypothetical protein
MADMGDIQKTAPREYTGNDAVQKKFHRFCFIEIDRLGCSTFDLLAHNASLLRVAPGK